MGNTDSIPILSQAKSFVQVISGDVDGAVKTQENFMHMAPVVSQITSLAHALDGDNEAAEEVQKKFLKGTEAFVDGLPVIGHAKGAVHYALGENDKGDEIMKGASKSFLTIPLGVAGFVAGGPVGGAAAAVAAAQAYDGIVTGIDTAVNGEVDGSPRYYGSWSTYDRIGRGKASPGEIFDTSAGIAFDAISGVVGGKIGSGFKGYLKAVGREVGDSIPGSRIFKPKRKTRYQKHGNSKNANQNKKLSNGFKDRCRRDAEYHLTTDESSFVKERLALRDGSVGNIISSDWRNMTMPDTISNLVSLFVVLKLVLWNDKNGRNFSRELCSYTSESENELDNCQFELLTNLRLLDNQMQYDTDQNVFKFMMDPDIPSAMGNSSRFMIQIITELYGILSSMGDHRRIGVLWAEELCLFEQPGKYISCENELIKILHETSLKAHSLGHVRKRRTTCTPNKGQQSSRRAKKIKKQKPNVNLKLDGGNIPPLSNFDPSQIKSKMVGPYPKIKSPRYRNENNINTRTLNLEANHIPPRTLCKKLGLKENEIIAHYIPKEIHQKAMTYVGTSKNSKVSKSLRQHQETLVKAGKLDQAIALDFIGSYGRANTKLATSLDPKTFRPALIEYRNDLHAVINGYVGDDLGKIGTSKISKRQALEDEVTYYHNHKHITVSEWMDNVEGRYDKILQENGLEPLNGYKVSPENRGFGR